MMKYDVIIFDVDDTLFDFRKSEQNALQETFEHFGYPTGYADYYAGYREISKQIWLDLEQGRIAIQELGVERFRRLIVEYDLPLDAVNLSETYLRNLGKEAHLMDGAQAICESLHQKGCRLSIITNGFANVQKPRIQQSTIKGLFEQVIISEEAGFQKPDSRIFEFAFSRLELEEKSKVLMVGDSLTSDIQGGNQYGIDTCWFNPHEQINHVAIEPTYEIRHLSELLKVVEQ